MDAIFCRDKKNFDAQIKELKNISFSLSNNHYRFCEYDENLEAKANGKDSASLYGVLGDKQRFSTFIIGKDFHLFPSQWARSFLNFSFDLVKEGGFLVVPIFSKNDPLNVLSLSYLESFLGKSTKKESSDFNIINFLKKYIKRLCLRSVEYSPPSKQEYAFFKKTKWEKDCKEYSTLDIFLEKKKYFIDALRTPLETEDMNIDAKALLQHAYYVGGMRYKAPLVKYIIRQCLEDSQPKKMIDMGAGYGLLGTELLLDSGLNIHNIVNCDISDVNEKIYNIISSALPNQLKDKNMFVKTASEDYDFGNNNHIVSFVGSLLYVDRAFVQSTLQKAFHSLSKGGILIVHENIKHPNYIADFDKMFTVDELEKYMNPFGEIHYYSSVICKKLEKKSIGNNTVFRVIQKV